MEKFLDQFTLQVANIVPKMGLGLLAFVGFFILASAMERVLKHFRNRSSPDRRTVFNLISQTLRFVILTCGVITALGTIGVNVSALVAGLGLTGFALGFALRDALSNTLAGVLILFYHPFKLGDRISTSGLEGTVVDIDLRYTTLKPDGRVILIPNQNLFVNPIIINDEAESKPENEQMALFEAGDRRVFRGHF
jgi:small-conductance mechanosensitive channel